MQSADFMKNLSMRYPKINDNELSKKDILDNIQKYSNSGRERLWKAFVDDYVYDRTPKWSNINQIAKSYGIDKAVGKSFTYWNCDKCGSNFGISARYCPTCKTQFSGTVVQSEKPEKFIECLEDCGICKYYTGFNKGEPIFGPICDKYGSERAGIERECQDCKCIRCCFEMRAEREHLSGNSALFMKMTRENKFEHDRLKYKA